VLSSECRLLLNLQKWLINKAIGVIKHMGGAVL